MDEDRKKDIGWGVLIATALLAAVFVWVAAIATC